MKLIPTAISRRCAWPFKAVARIFRNYVIPPVKAARSGVATAVMRFVWRPIMAVTSFVKGMLLLLLLKPLWRFLLKPLWRFVLWPFCWFVTKFRRPIFGVATIAAGCGIVYGGYLVLPMQTPQEIWYNDGVDEIRKDFANQHGWSSFKNPDVPKLQKSILYFNGQAEAGLLDRLLYGAPNAELASQAYLKIGVILLYNADDEKLVQEAKEYLEKAVLLNPGMQYARDLLADVNTIDRYSVIALAAERNLEMLYQQHPESRSKKPGKKGKGDEQGDPQNGDQKGEPDQPNDQPGDESQDKKQGEQAPSSKNDSLQQNQSDVRNGVGNDGI